jgi:hypothetical protein
VAVYKSKGIVLRSIRYGEADRILDLYTRDAGLVSAIAKGIRRTRSRFGARLEPLSCVDFVAYHGRTLDTVTHAEVLRSFRYSQKVFKFVHERVSTCHKRAMPVLGQPYQASLHLSTRWGTASDDRLSQSSN